MVRKVRCPTCSSPCKVDSLTEMDIMGTSSIKPIYEYVQDRPKLNIYKTWKLIKGVLYPNDVSNEVNGSNSVGKYCEDLAQAIINAYNEGKLEN